MDDDDDFGDFESSKTNKFTQKPAPSPVKPAQVQWPIFGAPAPQPVPIIPVVRPHEVPKQMQQQPVRQQVPQQIPQQVQVPGWTAFPTPSAIPAMQQFPVFNTPQQAGLNSFPSFPAPIPTVPQMSTFPSFPMQPGVVAAPLQQQIPQTMGAGGFGSFPSFPTFPVVVPSVMTSPTVQSPTTTTLPHSSFVHSPLPPQQQQQQQQQQHQQQQHATVGQQALKQPSSQPQHPQHASVVHDTSVLSPTTASTTAVHSSQKMMAPKPLTLLDPTPLPLSSPSVLSPQVSQQQHVHPHVPVVPLPPSVSMPVQQPPQPQRTVPAFAPAPVQTIPAVVPLSPVKQQPPLSQHQQQHSAGVQQTKPVSATTKKEDSDEDDFSPFVSSSAPAPTVVAQPVSAHTQAQLHPTTPVVAPQPLSMVRPEPHTLPPLVTTPVVATAAAPVVAGKPTYDQFENLFGATASEDVTTDVSSGSVAVAVNKGKADSDMPLSDDSEDDFGTEFVSAQPVVSAVPAVIPPLPVSVVGAGTTPPTWDTLFGSQSAFPAVAPLPVALPLPVPQQTMASVPVVLPVSNAVSVTSPVTSTATVTVTTGTAPSLPITHSELPHAPSQTVTASSVPPPPVPVASVSVPSSVPTPTVSHTSSTTPATTTATTSYHSAASTHSDSDSATPTTGAVTAAAGEPVSWDKLFGAQSGFSSSVSVPPPSTLSSVDLTTTTTMGTVSALPPRSSLPVQSSVLPVSPPQPAHHQHTETVTSSSQPVATTSSFDSASPVPTSNPALPISMDMIQQTAAQQGISPEALMKAMAAMFPMIAQLSPQPQPPLLHTTGVTQQQQSSLGATAHSTSSQQPQPQPSVVSPRAQQQQQQATVATAPPMPSTDHNASGVSGLAVSSALLSPVSPPSSHSTAPLQTVSTATSTTPVSAVVTSMTSFPSFPAFPSMPVLDPLLHHQPQGVVVPSVAPTLTTAPVSVPASHSVVATPSLPPQQHQQQQQAHPSVGVEEEEDDEDWGDFASNTTSTHTATVPSVVPSVVLSDQHQHHKHDGGQTTVGVAPSFGDFSSSTTATEVLPVRIESVSASHQTLAVSPERNIPMDGSQPLADPISMVPGESILSSDAVTADVDTTTMTTSEEEEGAVVVEEPAVPAPKVFELTLEGQFAAFTEMSNTTKQFGSAATPVNEVPVITQSTATQWTRILEVCLTELARGDSLCSKYNIHIIRANEAHTYLKGLVEVYRIVRRIAAASEYLSAMSVHKDAQELMSTIRQQLTACQTHWQKIHSFAVAINPDAKNVATYSLSASDWSHVSSSYCSLCCTPPSKHTSTSLSDMLVSMDADVLCHAPCANLWLHKVGPRPPKPLLTRPL